MKSFDKLLSKLYVSFLEVLLCTVCGAQAYEYLSNEYITVEAYVDSNFKGSTMNFTFNTCVSLKDSPNFDKTISSLWFTHCVNLYRTYDCTDTFIVLNKDIPTNNDLSAWNYNFNDNVSSLSPCYKDCHPSRIQRLVADGQVRVELFTETESKGYQWETNLRERECQQFPLRLSNKASTVKVHGEYCVELHESLDCTGRKVQVMPEIPFKDHLRFWNWVNDGTKAVSLCGYGCITNITNRNAEIIRKPGDNSIALFSEPNFGGLRRDITLSESCTDLRDEWEGHAMSIDTFGVCVQLYESHMCKDEAKVLHIEKKQTNLEISKFDKILRSLKLCVQRKSLEDGSIAQGSYVTIGIAILILFIMFSGISTVFIVRFRKKYQKALDNLSGTEIEEFLNGTEDIVVVSASQQNQQSVLYSQPYDRNYEILRSFLEVDMKTLLGSGEYAHVFRGTLKKPDSSSSMVVAVKTLKPNAGRDYLLALLREIKVMIYVGKHPNIVRLIGCCTDRLSESKLHVVTELYENGSLDTYLENHKDTFSNNVTRSKTASYCNFSTCGNDPNYYQQYFSTANLLQWSLEVAEGMEHLEQKRVIHGDLAVRNILLDQNLTAKIGDFGLSKQLYECSEYVKTKKVPLPWRYLAIESLKNLQFSTKSDVWGYGVTMWEIFSLGDVPYPGTNFDQTFVNALSDGFRMSKPKLAPAEGYAVMMNCWKKDPSHRPTFTQIRLKLQDMIKPALTTQT